MKRVAICDGKVYIEDDRWITINADKETGQKGKKVYIKDNHKRRRKRRKGTTRSD